MTVKCSWEAKREEDGGGVGGGGNSWCERWKVRKRWKLRGHCAWSPAGWELDYGIN